MGRIDIIPVTFEVANRFVSQFHRHNQKTQGGKVTIGLEKDGVLVGVAIAGRPVARMLDDGATAEITRVCVKEGVKNGSSMLYARMRRILQIMGYKKIITYTLQSETGASMRAINAKIVAEVKPQRWKVKGKVRKNAKVQKEPKYRWEL